MPSGDIFFAKNVAVGDGWRNTVRGTPPRDMALTKEKLIGDYDWGALCLPTVPWSKTTRKMPFFARNDDTPLLVAAVMGLQHCFAMIGGRFRAASPPESPRPDPHLSISGAILFESMVRVARYVISTRAAAYRAVPSVTRRKFPNFLPLRVGAETASRLRFRAIIPDDVAPLPQVSSPLPSWS